MEQERKSEITIDGMNWEEKSTYAVMRKYCSHIETEGLEIFCGKTDDPCATDRSQCPLFKVEEPETPKIKYVGKIELNGVKISYNEVFDKLFSNQLEHANKLNEVVEKVNNLAERVK